MTELLKHPINKDNKRNKESEYNEKEEWKTGKLKNEAILRRIASKTKTMKRSNEKHENQKTKSNAIALRKDTDYQ